MPMLYFFRVFVQDQSDYDNDEDEWVSFDSVCVSTDFGPCDPVVLLENDEEIAAKSELKKIALHKIFRASVHYNVDDNTLSALFFLEERELTTAIDIESYKYDSEQGKDAVILLSSMTFNAKIIGHSIDFEDNYEFRFQIVGNVGLSDALDVSVALGMAEKETQAGPSPSSAKDGRHLAAAFAGIKDSATRNEIIDKYSGSLRSFSTRPWRKLSSVRTRFWSEAGLATLSGFLGLLTLFTRDWIEALTGFDPDNHDGSFEWAIVAALFSVCVLSSLAACADWRRLNSFAQAGI